MKIKIEFNISKTNFKAVLKQDGLELLESHIKRKIVDSLSYEDLKLDKLNKAVYPKIRKFSLEVKE